MDRFKSPLSITTPLPGENVANIVAIFLRQTQVSGKIRRASQRDRRTDGRIDRRKSDLISRAYHVILGFVLTYCYALLACHFWPGPNLICFLKKIKLLNFDRIAQH